MSTTTVFRLLMMDKGSLLTGRFQWVIVTAEVPGRNRRFCEKANRDRAAKSHRGACALDIPSGLRRGKTDDPSVGLPDPANSLGMCLARATKSGFARPPGRIGAHEGIVL